ncbi:MAG: hypothetical protein V3R83_09745 [Gammaproteobacteria bacterium]
MLLPLLYHHQFGRFAREVLISLKVVNRQDATLKVVKEQAATLPVRK